MKNIKVRIGSYDVEISAHNWIMEENDTLGFLNELSIIYSEAAKKMISDGYDIVGGHYEHVAHTIFEVCKENGLYEGLK